MSRPESKLTVADARTLVRDAGLRSTSCRIAVLQHLEEKGTPCTHADVAESLVPEGFDKSTVYRCLTEMADAGLLNRFDLGDHVWRFERKREEKHDRGEHPHFVCVDCGKVTCLPDVDVSLGGARQRRSSGVADVTEVLVKGHCVDCK